MDTFVTRLGIGAMVAVVAFLVVMLSALFGGIAGWIVGLMYGESILGIAAQLGIHGITMFQFGVFLGFVGGFFKSNLSKAV